MERTTICVVLPTWVGDACLATPSLRALRRAFPIAHIVGVMRPVIGELLDDGWGAGAPWFDECLLFNKRAQPGQSSRWGLIAQLRKQHAGVAVLLTNSLWSAAVARMAGARRIVGYDRDARGWLLTDRVPVPRAGRRPLPISPIDYYLKLAEHIGADTSDRAMQLGIKPLDRQMCDELWSKIGFSDAIPTIVINSGAATMATRLWPSEKVQQLASRIANELDWQVLLHCGPGERESVSAIAAAAGHPKIASMGVMPQLPIGLSKSVLARAAGVVSTDSGPRHVAVALDRPVVTLYGPTDPAWTTTYNLPEIAIAETLACRPCYQSPCPLKHSSGDHHRCMRDISVDRVLAAIVASQSTAKPPLRPSFNPDYL